MSAASVNRGVPHRVVVGKAAVVAAGAWSGDLVMAAAAPCSPATDWQAAIRPRRGHLLEVPACVAPRIVHGLMESDYAKVRQAIPFEETQDPTRDG